MNNVTNFAEFVKSQQKELSKAKELECLFRSSEYYKRWYDDSINSTAYQSYLYALQLLTEYFNGTYGVKERVAQSLSQSTGKGSKWQDFKA